MSANSLKGMVRYVGILGRTLKGGLIAVTRRGASKSQGGLHRFGPEIWEQRRGVRPVHRRGDASIRTRFWEVAVEHIWAIDRRDGACAGASAPTHTGEPLRDFQGQAAEFKGIVASAMEMPQVRLILGAAAVPSPAARIGGSGGHQGKPRSGAPKLDLRQRISPKTRAGADGEMEGR